MTEDTRDDQHATATTTTTAAPAPAQPALAAIPGLQALDLGLDASIGMVCDIDDPDCNPMAFAGTSGAPSDAASTGDDA